jgi:selenocysteine-specific elongation factor
VNRAPEASQTTRRLAVVGTAGHIDHGKTALVRRLTGVDTDRLPEEKKRGISIDLGFAPLVTPQGIRVGVVDVPGHERFVKNMLSGASGIDLVLLVIAADEGVMPQTREHLAIVRLLGVRRGIVVLTKRDLVDSEWTDLVKRDVRALLEGTEFAQAPLIEFSAITGLGATTLLEELDRQLEELATRSTEEPARLPIDRVFTMEGFGTVVTGTLWRGRMRTGDRLDLLPAGRAVRVRRVQVHGAAVEEALAGQRTALALHGVARDEVARGDWLAAPGSLSPSSVLDVRFELLPDYPRQWPASARVRFHLGASEILGRLVLLEGARLLGGQTALAQLRLERPTAAARGDRFVIRSYSPSRTVGGGSVIEAAATKRRKTASLDQLKVDEGGSLTARLREKLERAAKPTPTAVLAQAVSASSDAVGEALSRLAAQGEVVRVVDGVWLSVARWQSARDVLLGKTRDFAARYPARYGIPKGELKSKLAETVDPGLFDAAFASLLAEQAIELRGERVRSADTPWSPPAAALRALERMESELEATGLAVPDTRQLQSGVGSEAAEVMALGYFLGRLVRVSQEFTYTSRQMKALQSKLAAHFARQSQLSVADFKALAGVSRKYAVPLLEHGDRMGWMVRAGDERRAGAKLASESC